MQLSLWSLKAGDRARIVSFDDALADSYQIRMLELGFHPGEEVSCAQSPALGAPKVYRVSNSIFSLDEEIAAHIHITALAVHE